MSKEDSAQEKTEEPTQKKRDDAKKKGQVARSKELVVSMMFIGSAMIILWVFPDIFEIFKTMTKHSFMEFGIRASEKHVMFSEMTLWGLAFIEALIPILGITALLAILSSIALGGWTMSMKSIQPKLEKISPIKGMKRIFSMKGLMELIKSIFKITIVGSVGWLLFLSYKDEIILLPFHGLNGALEAVAILGWFFIITSSALFVIAFIDVPFQIYNTTKELKMTKQDIKDEMKDTEGRPEVKMKRKQIARQLAFSRQMDDVPNADVIITNPTHYSIAIRYNSATDEAPIVIAAGTDMLALKIRTIAKQHNVNIVESPPLARSLYYFCEAGEEIHPGLYESVAKILTYVYMLNDYKSGNGKKPNLGAIEINEELKR